MVIISPFLEMEIQAIHGAHTRSALSIVAIFASNSKLRSFIFFSLRFLTNLDTGSKKDHFYLFNGPKIAQKIWILVKKRALKFILHAYISKYFRQTKLPCRGVLNISASPFFTVLTSLSSIQKRKLC